jgi:tetraacyldisaccharide 4'-kinase
VAAEIGCDVAILDDGFQHRRLARDVDIVLTSASDAASLVLPAGPLREPLAALARADFVVATDERAPTTSSPAFRARQVASGLVCRLAPDERPAPMTTLRGREIVAVAGLARPERFLDLLTAAGATFVRPARVFRDHHSYNAADAAMLLRDAGTRASIVTTEKDLVKLARLMPADAPLQAVRIDLELDGGDALLGRVRDVIERLDARASELHHPGLT